MQVATDRLCPSCSRWLCREDDAYCGACGRTCAQLALEAISSVLPLGQVAPRVGLRMRNPTCARAQVTYVISPDWLDVAIPTEPVIEPGGSLLLRGVAKTFTMRQPDSADVTVRTTLGDASALMMVIHETPELTTSPAAFEYWPNRQETHDYVLNLSPVSGRLRVRSVTEPKEGWLSFVTAFPAPVLAGHDRPLALVVRVDSARLAGLRIGTGRTVSARAGIEYDGPHGPAHANFDVALEVRLPPELAWTGEHQPPRQRLQTAGQIIGFTIANSLDTDNAGGRRNASLELRDVLLDPPAGSRATAQRLSPVLPVTIAGGESAWIEFQANCESLAPGIHYFSLRVQSNRTALDRRIRVPILIEPVQPFDGIVAVDFGTSNSCCALLPDGEDVRLVPLDQPRTTGPTVVRYLDLRGPEPVIETGLAVKRLAAVDEGVAGQTLDRLKQRLGEAAHALPVRPKESAEWVTREAREAAADYLHHLRSIAEKREGASFHEFILTHPAVCSLQQYRNLRWAVQRAFGADARVHFLQEPLASLVPFINTHSLKADPQGYTVAAFDMGGGTTDITVVRVTYRWHDGVLMIQPEILASWGENFGGESLTDFLVLQLKTRCQRLLADERPGYQVADRAVRGASTPSIRRNESALREWADAFKADLSNDTERRVLPSEITVTLIPPTLDQVPLDHTFAVDQLRRAGEPLEEFFLRFLRDEMGRLTGLLERTVTTTRLDFIQLSGKTTFLSEIGVLMRERFPHVEIERAEEPKECVVRGACLWHSLSRGHRRRLVLSHGVSRTTSQIGLVNEDHEFEPLIALDQPIPDDGLTANRRGAWSGQGPVILWENLGADNSRLRSDGTLNPAITRLGLWDPTARVHGERWDLQLVLRPDFSLEVAVASGDQRLVMNRRSTFRDMQ